MKAIFMLTMLLLALVAAKSTKWDGALYSPTRLNAVSGVSGCTNWTRELGSWASATYAALNNGDNILILRQPNNVKIGLRLLWIASNNDTVLDTMLPLSSNRPSWGAYQSPSIVALDEGRTIVVCGASFFSGSSNCLSVKSNGDFGYSRAFPSETIGDVFSDDTHIYVIAGTTMYVCSYILEPQAEFPLDVSPSGEYFWENGFTVTYFNTAYVVLIDSDYSYTLVAIDIGRETVSWKTLIASPLSFAYNEGGSYIMITPADDRSSIYGLYIDGSISWKTPVGNQAIGGIVSDDLGNLFINMLQNVASVDYSGKILWNTQVSATSGSFNLIGMSLQQDNNLLIQCAEQRGLVSGLDATTGRRLFTWTPPPGNLIASWQSGEAVLIQTVGYVSSFCPAVV